MERDAGLLAHRLDRNPFDQLLQLVLKASTQFVPRLPWRIDAFNESLNAVDLLGNFLPSPRLDRDSQLLLLLLQFLLTGEAGR